MRIDRIKDDSTFESSELPLVAIISMSHPIEAIDRRLPNKTKFIFKRNKQLDQLIEGYWRGELQIEPKLFFNQLKLIKSRIYENY